MAVINVQTPIVKRLFGRTVLAIKDIKKLAAQGRFWPIPACHDRPVSTQSRLSPENQSDDIRLLVFLSR
jgi:hypothetical protein